MFPPRKRIFVSRKRKFVSGVLYHLALSHYEIFPVPPGHWLSSLLVQHALTIRDSRLCRLHSNVSLSTMCCFLDGTHFITLKPTGFYSRHKHKGWPFFRELNTKWIRLPKVVGEPSHPKSTPTKPNLGHCRRDCLFAHASGVWHRYVPPQKQN